MIAWRPRPPVDAPQYDEAHLWRLDLDERADIEILSAEERARAARFAFEKDRLRFIAGRSGLRRVLAFYIGMRPSDIALRPSGRGAKPALAASGAAIDFNMSKSEGLGLVAVSASRPIGVDVEKLSRATDIDLVASEQFSDDERATLRRLPATQRAEAFFRGWTAKEALIKLTGEGLSADLKALSIEIDPERQPTLRAGYGPYDPSRIRLVSGVIPSDFVFTLAIEGQSPVVTGYDLGLMPR